MPDNDLDESDCCGNGCTNCILDNKPKPSQRTLLAGKRNIILSYANFRLLKNEPYKDDALVRLLHFVYEPSNEEDDDDCVLDIPPGYHVMLRAELMDHAGPLLRPYSPYWTDFAGKEFKILVKLQPDGPMSGYLSSLRNEQLLQFRGPIGNYVHDPTTAKHIVIIAQGVAIAPTLPLVSQVLDNDNDNNRIHHLICARDLEHVYFREQLLEFAQFWNYSSCLYLPHQPKDGDGNGNRASGKLRYKEMAHFGRLDGKQLKVQVKPHEGSIVVIIAGYSSFQRQMQEHAADAFTISDDSIYLL